MCAATATSREHAPPQSFFPDQTTFGRDVRRNLITVPSCDKHNSAKSKDDEFLRAVILMTSAQQSDAARHQFFAKLLSAAKRKPAAYNAFLNARETVLGGTGRILQFDRPRLNACLDRLIRALHFHTYRRPWDLPILVVSPNIVQGVENDAPVPHRATLQVVDVTRGYLGGETIRGENPEVFKYRIRTEPEVPALACAMQFYDLFEAYAYSSPTIPTPAA